MSFEEVASVLFVDDSTVRIWLKAFSEAASKRSSCST